MILYFSGTGNSQFVAVRIAEMIGDEVLSINQYLKKEQKTALHAERPFVFVTPTYSWRMPKVVEQWILETDFSGSGKAYFILTCGGSCGNAALYAERLCQKKNLQFCGLSPVLMPENYLALFPTPVESECMEIVEKAKPHIAALAEQIRNNKHFTKLPVSFRDKLQSGPVNPLFYAFFVHDKGFTVSNDCISCGRCVQRCALNNIDLREDTPVWKGNCTHCMACIGGCPAKAIDYNANAADRYHYYIMDDSLCWGNGGENH